MTHKKCLVCLRFSLSEVIFHLPNLALSVNSHNKQFKQTLNARRFWFASGLVLPSNAESEPVRFGLLNWALYALGISEQDVFDTSNIGCYLPVI